MGRIVLLLALAVCGANAQTINGTVAGSVRDASGAIIAGAEVRLVSIETGESRGTRTDAEGFYTVALVPAGPHQLEVSHLSHRQHVEQLTIRVAQSIRADVTLQPGLATERMEVTAERGLLRTERVALGGVIDNRSVTGLPLDGRNWTELSLLTPGVVPPAPGSATSVRGNVSLSINGGREDANGYLLDGVYNGNPNLNSSGIVPSPDAIREFEVVTGSYDASFGRNGAGQVNVVVKSGANAIHGTAYEFFRNAALDARNFFAPANEPDPKYQRNQFGAAVGGPLVRNRTFWFADYEGRRTNEGITRLTRVPTALERQGDFSQSAVPFIIDPFTQRPFPNKQIPRERQHPTGVAIANLYPLPNRSGQQNFVSSPTLTDRNNQFDARVDHKLGPRTDLAVRYSFADQSLYEPFTGPNFAAVPGYGDDVPRRVQNVMLSETHAFSATTLNEFRASFNRNASQVLQQNRDTNLNRSVGLPSPWTNSRDNGLTLLTLVGYSPLGDEYNNPQRTVLNVYQINDQISFTRGRHLLKAGFDWRYAQQNAFRDIQARGLINFYGFTGDAVADMLQGLPVASGIAQSDNPQALRSSSYNFFLNDNWKLAPRVTLTLGVRYEFNTPPVDKHDKATVYDPATGRLVPVGQSGMPRAGFNSDGNNFAPRLGLAWSVRDTTVIRAGYGLYFDQSALAPGEGLYFNPPQFNFSLFVALPQFPLLLHNPWPSNYPFPTPPSALAFQRDLRTGYMQHFSFGVQQQVGTGRVFEITYAGATGTKLIGSRDINQGFPSASPIVIRPNRAFSDINQFESSRSSNYHSLQARFEQRLWKGFSALAGYTWSKSIDNGSSFFPSGGDPNFPQNSLDLRAERARSNFDVPHGFVASYAWDLPFGKGALLGGWQTFGIWTFQSGRPFTVALPSELDNSGTGRSSLGFGANDRPHLVGNPRLETRTPERWFNTRAFAMPAPGTFGNAGRNIVEGPGLQTINVSIVKNIPIRESVSLQFRAEAFNLFNHANFGLPDLFFGSPTFGSVSSASAPRHIQFGLKLLF
jgi:outer membrane receptor protein involved in Fe transport